MELWRPQELTHLNQVPCVALTQFLRQNLSVCPKMLMNEAEDSPDMA